MDTSFVNRIVISTCLSLPLISLTALSALAGTINIEVINNSGEAIRALYISPANKEDWSSDQISKTIPDFGRYDILEWDDYDLCFFDFRAEYEDGTSTDLRDVDLCRKASVIFKEINR
ncbi:MAG: hypothetical protein RSE13_12310 [Planktothrix sp. GU0601_MAG3]|nr:MAG: hypothetical protein RSE13_12310 [Planktothrix sp. GU0601_MAG3]